MSDSFDLDADTLNDCCFPVIDNGRTVDIAPDATPLTDDRVSFG